MNKDLLTKFKQFKKLEDLPKDIKISTITMTCNFDTEFNVENIGKYFDLKNNVVNINYESIDGKQYHRSLLNNIKKNKKKKTKRSFYNQVTIGIKTSNDKIVNIKIFINGSIQMTGCDGLYSCIEGLETLCNEIKKVKGIINPSISNKIIIKTFTTKPDNVVINKINDVKIRMINSNFDIGFQVNREKLYKILLDEKINCVFEPIIHACVNIKFNYKNKEKISIFVFESGAIIITGAKTKNQIFDAYKFITKRLIENYYNIVVKSFDSVFEKFDINQFIINHKNNKISNII